MKKKKQSKKKRGNGKQIAMVVIVIFLIAAIVGALLWLSDLGSNWDVRTWGDKFSKQEQTKPGNSGSNKPIIPVIPEQHYTMRLKSETRLRLYTSIQAM